jgi:NADH-quinone oxidoreductase subunit M
VFVNQLAFPLLSLLIGTPLVGALLIGFTASGARSLQRTIAWIFSSINAVLAIYAVTAMQPVGGYQFVESIDWLADIGLKYAVGLDGINVWMVVLATLLTPLALFAARNESTHQKSFHALILVLSAALIGAFVATDLLLFFVFFELTLVPTALLIATQGTGDAKAAALKFFVYPFVGSVFMLASIAGLVVAHFQQTGLMTFDSVIISGAVLNGTLVMDDTLERALFAGFFLAFAIKTPIWPFHTWMPQAQAATPSNGSVDIAGILLKIGAYGMLRFALPFFPNAAVWAAPAIGILAVISILYSAIIAFSQQDMKVLLSYATISHLGFVMLGIFSQTVEGITGALITMINSGLTTGALFLIVGILAAQRGSRNRDDFSGVWLTAPTLGTLTLITVFASIGVPGLNGFVGEFLSMQGAWLAPQLGYGYVSFAIIGIILSAAYLLRMYRGVFMGAAPDEHAIHEPKTSVLAVLSLLVVAMIVIGLYPSVITAVSNASVDELVRSLTASSR